MLISSSRLRGDLSGLAMLAIDARSNPAHWCEIAGVGLLVRLALIGLAASNPGLVLAVFWSLIVLSTELSHAPGSCRHL